MIAPDAPQALHRQRIEELELAVRRHHQQPVRLRRRARHLGQELRARDTHADRQPDLPRARARRSRARVAAGVPAKCSIPRTSRKASSIDSASTVGAVSSKITKTALLASVYASNRHGTTAASGHRYRARAPPIPTDGLHRALAS